MRPHVLGQVVVGKAKVEDAGWRERLRAQTRLLLELAGGRLLRALTGVDLSAGGDDAATTEAAQLSPEQHLVRPVARTGDKDEAGLEGRRGRHADATPVMRWIENVRVTGEASPSWPVTRPPVTLAGRNKPRLMSPPAST